MDLVEIKLSCVEIFDREDAREVKALESCRNELLALGGKGDASNVIEMPKKRASARGRTRPQAQAV
jgi:hypothetical protein